MSNTTGKVTTRIAPSPTGHLHIGTVRTALINYLFAQKHNGRFIMRSEDTDTERSTKESEDEIIDGLTWIGFSWDTFYRQSERKDIYKGYLTKLIDEEKAYVSREESIKNHDEMVEVVRLKNPNKTITFTDEVRGEISFNTTELGDFVIARSVDDALYHFTVVVDDHEMEITHVIRGEDHISNTPRQILIQEAIGAERPVYVHLPLILAPDRSKLSKRHGVTMFSEYREQGFIPPAIINYLALLGWNPGTDQEVFTFEELIKAFDLSGIQKGGAIFDIEKLKWFNREHLKSYSDAELLAYLRPTITERITSLPQYNEERFERLIPIFRERTSTSEDTAHELEAGEYDFAFQAPNVPASLLKWKNDPGIKATLSRLQKLAEIIATIPEGSSAEEIKEVIWEYALEAGKGEVLWPLRVALTGMEKSPDPFSVLSIIGSGEAYKRIIKACDTILKCAE